MITWLVIGLVVGAWFATGTTENRWRRNADHPGPIRSGEKLYHVTHADWMNGEPR